MKWHQRLLLTSTIVYFQYVISDWRSAVVCWRVPPHLEGVGVEAALGRWPQGRSGHVRQGFVMHLQKLIK